jgi:hypothetical protein
MDYLRFPAWQSLCADAIEEFDPKKLLVRIGDAEAAVLRRAKQLKNSTTEDDERLAIVDTLKSLRLLGGLHDNNRPLRANL